MSADLANTVDRRRQYSAGGTMSLNRAITPSQLFGHGNPEVGEAVIAIIRPGVSPVVVR